MSQQTEEQEPDEDTEPALPDDTVEDTHELAKRPDANVGPLTAEKAMALIERQYG